MNISKIRASNFMGASFIHDLGPLTLIIGENMRGKTRVQRAGQLALGGFVPGMGRRNSDIYEDLGNGNPVLVEVQFDTGQKFTRAYSKERNTVSCGIRNEGLPTEWAVPSVLIDAEEYFQLSGKERINFLFSACDLSTSDFSVPELVADVKNIKLEVNTKETEKVLREIVEEITDGDQEREHDGKPLQTWLDELTVSLEKKLQEANAAVKRMDGTVKGLVELQAQSDAPAVAGSVEGDLAAARQQLTDAQAELARLENQRGELQRRLARKIEIETQLGGAEDPTAKIADKEKQVADCEKSVANYTSEASTKRDRLALIRQEIGMLGERVKNFTAQADKLETELAKKLAATECPCCHASGTDWKERIEKQDRKAIDALKENAGKVQAEVDRLRADEKTLVPALTAAENADREAEKVRQIIATMQRDVAALRRQQQATESMRGELKGLADVVSSSGFDEQIGTARATRDAKLKRVADLDEKNRALQQQRAQAQAQAKAVEQGKLNVAEQKVTKLALEVVMTAKNKLTEDTIGALLSVANSIALPILSRPLVYQDRQIGWVPPNSTRFQSHTTFCGTERGVTFAALSIALAVKSPIKVVMIDELGIIDPKRKIELLLLMRRLVHEKVIDQFIGNDVSDRDYAGLTDEVSAEIKWINL